MMDLEFTSSANAFERDLVGTAAYLDVDLTDAARLVDLVAVAITQLAWRNGLVELWHGASPSRISNAEMMRANAATTRVVRRHLRERNSVGLTAIDADVLQAVCDVLTDPGRRLPDGRTVLEFAVTEDFEMYVKQVQAVIERCRRLIDQWGVELVVAVLACYAAAACWKWWLAPGWPSIVTKIIDFLDGRPADSISAVARRTVRLPARRDLTRLRQILLSGPDNLSAHEARCCLAAGISTGLPQDHGLSPRSRRLLPSAFRQFVAYLEFPTENFRRKLENSRASLIPSSRGWA